MKDYKSDIDKLVRRRQLEEPAENAKIGVVAILILSLVVFSAMGKENVKHIIWYWVGFMALLLVLCSIQDVIIKRKIKREGL